MLRSDDIAGLIDEARQRFGAELNDVSQAIGGHLARALSDISNAHSSSETVVHTDIARILIVTVSMNPDISGENQLFFSQAGFIFFQKSNSK